MDPLFKYVIVWTLSVVAILALLGWIVKPKDRDGHGG